MWIYPYIYNITPEKFLKGHFVDTPLIHFTELHCPQCLDSLCLYHAERQP